MDRQRRIEQHPLGTGVNIAGQQQALTIGLNLQHTGILIAVSRPRPMPQGKPHSVPLPLLATDTGQSAQFIRQVRRFAADHLRDR
ncbi:hypothetical protein D3C81_1933520 [compost metagenome]